jgi:hypothetical protein
MQSVVEKTAMAAAAVHRELEITMFERPLAVEGCK